MANIIWAIMKRVVFYDIFYLTEINYDKSPFVQLSRAI